MLPIVFISYSSADALAFATRLHQAIASQLPYVSPWLDKVDIKPGRDWDDQVVEALRSCDALLYVMSPDSVEPQSVCKTEWTRALKYKKPVVPLLQVRGVEIPFGLGNRQYIDFTTGFESALTQLGTHLQWLASPPGVLQAMKDRLGAARRDLQRSTDDAQRTRIQDDVALLEKQIADQQRLLDDPQGVAARVEESIARGLERERQPKIPTAAPARAKFINPPPGIAPSYFQDRTDETLLAGNFLKDDSKRLITIVGRGGIGKTALVCRLLKSLETGELPDNGGSLRVDGIVYLSAVGSRRVTLPNLLADLGRLLPETAARELDSLYRDPKLSVELKMQALLKHFTELRAVVLLDNFEDVVNPETRNISDAELAEGLRAVLSSPHHAVKVVLTTRIAPYDLAQVQPGRQVRFDLDDGLPSPHAENILRALDVDGKVGLRSAPDLLLDQARQRTRGFPRALEALFAILSADRDASLRDLLEDTKRLLPEHVVETLVGEAFSRLDAGAQQAMQALAIFRRPVSPIAVDFLLQPYRPGVDSAPILNRLVNMQLVRKESGLYYLHPVDRDYALSRIMTGDTSDRQVTKSPPFTQFALFHRGANYFEQTQKPRADWKTIDDLAPQLAEFDLRCSGQDYETASRVLDTIEHPVGFWGYSRLVIELYERLLGRVTDEWQTGVDSLNLGKAYDNVGRLNEAIDCFEQSLAICRKHDNKQGMGATLISLANCYQSLGQAHKAIELSKQGMDIAREIGRQDIEGSFLPILGACYSDMGQTRKAIAIFEQALATARETDDEETEGFCLSVLGTGYGALGQNALAIEYYQRALIAARETGYRYGVGFRLGNLAGAFVDGGRYAEALPLALESAQIALEIESPDLGSNINVGLAEIYLCAGDLASARIAAWAASQCNWPANAYNAFSVLALIALRQGDLASAEAAFGTAITAANAMLVHNELDYAALDAKGLASCGLALCGDLGQVPLANEAYRAARTINKEVGVVGRVLRLFDAISLCDSEGVIAPARTAAAGDDNV